MVATQSKAHAFVGGIGFLPAKPLRAGELSQHNCEPTRVDQGDVTYFTGFTNQLIVLNLTLQGISLQIFSDFPGVFSEKFQSSSFLLTSLGLGMPIVPQSRQLVDRKRGKLHFAQPTRNMSIDGKLVDICSHLD